MREFPEGVRTGFSLNYRLAAPPPDERQTRSLILRLSLIGFITALASRATDPIIPPIAHDIQVDPNAVVLGGAMTFGENDSEIGRDFIQRIRDEVRPRLLEPLRDKLRIEFASLGGDAGYIGAAGLARLEHSKAR